MPRFGLVGRAIVGATVLAAATRFAGAQVQEPCGFGALCLDSGHYQVFVSWVDSASNQHIAHPVSISDQSGYFWFFDSSNVELTTKVLDGCSVGGHEWIFVSGMTTLNVTVRVTDLLMNVHQDYVNPQGSVFETVVDTTTFSDCPGPSEGPVSGSWSGTFTSADFVDCDGPGAATATFEQNGTVITGSLDAPNLFCGPRHVHFAGALNGDLLTGTVTGSDYGNEPYRNANAFGRLSISGTQLNLTISNGLGLIPGGVLELHR